MRIAYLIGAHADPGNLARLVGALGAQDFYIHIDAKVDIEPFKLALPPSAHVLYVADRVEVFWGGYSQVESLVRLLRMAVANGPYDRIVMLTGMDYPTVPPEEIERRFVEKPLNEWLGARLVTGVPGMKEKVCRHWKFDWPIGNNAIRRVIRVAYNRVYGWLRCALGTRKPDKLYFADNSWDVWFGSDYWALTWSTATGLLTFLQEPEVVNYFRGAYAPVELMTPTYVCNTVPIKHIEFVTDGECRYEELCALHYEIYDPVIKVMDESDYEAVVSSGRMFFRKARSGISDILIEKLEGRTTGNSQPRAVERD